MSAVDQIPINCEYALATLGLYDYALTFNEEIRQVWQRKTSWTSILFFVNRYLIVATSIVILIKDIPRISSTSNSCTNLVLAQIVLDASLSICAACFFAAQAYALFDRPTAVLFVTAALGLACPVISLSVWAKAAKISLTAGQLGERCSTLSALQRGAYTDWLLAARACNLAANFVVLGSIVYKTQQSLCQIGSSALPYLLIKQGALFFVAIAAPNIAALGLGSVPILGANIPLHADSTTSILISRFILTLRRRFAGDGFDKGAGKGTDSSSQLSSVPTATFFNTTRPQDDNCIYSVV